LGFSTAASLREGRVWLFAPVEHHLGECVGAHVSVSSDRFTAMEPERQGVRRHFGALGAALVRGLSVHSDHGSQYTSSWLRAELRSLGITPSLALVGEPETNGIAERYIRTLKEQVIHGRVYEKIEALRRAVDDFVARHRAHWRLEKNRFRTPDEVRADINAARLTEAA
jgi:transposase InsO family protein